MSRANYHAGRHRHNHRLLIVIACAVLLIAGVVYGYIKFQARIKPVAETPTSSASPAPKPSTKTPAGRFDETLFTFEAPDDWQFDKHDTEPYDVYSYHGSLAGEYRYLDIYIDKIPQHLAVNRVVAVQAKGAGLSRGNVSDNCLKLAPGTSSGGNTGSTVASTIRIEGVDIMCDKDDKAHSIIAASAPGSSNKVVLTGPVTGQHDVLFVYNDSVTRPGYAVFYRILESFKVK